MEKNKLKKQFEFMKNNRLLISHTSFEIIDESGKIISKEGQDHLENLMIYYFHVI